MRPSVAGLRWRVLALAHDEDRRRRRRNRRRERAVLRGSVNPFEDLPEAEFIKTYRLGKDAVREVIEVVTPFLPRERRRDEVTPKLKVLIDLAFYASGSYQTLVGQSALHNVSQTTVSRAVRQVTCALGNDRVMSHYIKWPMQREERNVIKAEFYQKFKIPGVLGCIDGSHVAILRPHTNEERYYNRKGYHSLNVMVICDASHNILCVDPSSPGSAHDNHVWQSNPLSRHLMELNNNEEQVFLLGDSGYPLRETMMTPILNTREGTPEHYYYKKQVAARNTIEHCFGILKGRFRCLLAARALHYQPIMAAKIVNACCVLHNIANRSSAPVQMLTHEEAELEASHQNQVANELRTAANSAMETDPRSRRVNRDLLAGRALLRALVDRLWRERTSQIHEDFMEVAASNWVSCDFTRSRFHPTN